MQSISIFDYMEKFKEKCLIMDPRSYEIDWVPMDNKPLL